MKPYIYIIVILFFYSYYAKASSCLTDNEELKVLSLEKKDHFNISIIKTDDQTVAVTISAPKKINDRKLKGISAYAENPKGKMIYLFSISSTLKNGRFVSGYEISNDLVGDSYIQFYYGECGAVFTYRLATKEIAK